MNRYLLLLLMALSGPFVTGGATCTQWSHPAGPQPPAAFNTPPTLPDIVQAVNANTERVRQLQTESATLKIAGLPTSLRTTVELERPHRFRLRGKMFGPELDLGSNDETVWFWARRNPERVIYFARHTELAHIGAQRALPLDPQWLVQAFGLVHLDPQGSYEGPYSVDDDKVEIRSFLQNGHQRLVHTLVVDATYGWIVEQTVHDGQGRLLASVQSSEHRHDPDSHAALPHKIAVELPQANLSFEINISEYRVNQLHADPADLWSFPRMEGYEPVNLTAVQGPVRPSPERNPARAPHAPPGQHGQTREGYRPEYRRIPPVR